jgi:hypothetical protein
MGQLKNLVWVLLPLSTVAAAATHQYEFAGPGARKPEGRERVQRFGRKLREANPFARRKPVPVAPHRFKSPELVRKAEDQEALRKLFGRSDFEDSAALAQWRVTGGMENFIGFATLPAALPTKGLPRVIVAYDAKHEGQI